MSATFDFEWKRPEDSQLYWFWDRMHYPHPCTPLTSTFDAPAFEEGGAEGFDRLGVPLRMRVFAPHGYWYVGPELGVSLDELPQLREESMGRMLPELPHQYERWNDEHLPEVLRLNGELRQRDFAAMSGARMAEYLDELQDVRRKMWEIHMYAMLPVVVVAGEFAKLYGQVFGEGTIAEAYTLMQGFPNKSVEAGAKLFELSRDIAKRPVARDAILNTPVRRVIGELGKTEDGLAALDALNAYLDEYGWRGDAFELADPSWIEEPALALALLRELLRGGDDAHPTVRERRAAAQREELEKEVDKRIAGHPLEGMFRFLQGVCRQYVPLQEDHNFYIDQMNTVLMRRPLLEAGRRLAAAGAIAAANDVFYLTLDDLKDALTKPRDMKAAIQQRKNARRAAYELDPPSAIGTPPDEALQNDPTLSTFWGGQRRQSANPRVLLGAAASPGRASGSAKVVRTLSEAGKLEPGDVLVCEMTMPAWTPLFSAVSAVVADTGGALSHCAIVAREYGIPCVVGTVDGTRIIRDGQAITVDGSAGSVTIEG